MSEVDDIRTALSMIVYGAGNTKKTQTSMPTNIEGEAVKLCSVRKNIPKELKEDAEHVQQNASKGWLQDEGIQGIGIAKRESGDDLALKVYVKEKQPVRRRKRRAPFCPKNLRLDGRTNLKINDHVIPIDVEEIGELKVQADSLPRPGCSIFYGGIKDAGTFGCLVTKRSTEGAPPYYILSNSHVIANHGIADVNDPVVYPGEGDCKRGQRAKKIARLFQWVRFQAQDSELLNTCDAAIAEVIDEFEVSSIISELNEPPNGVNRRPYRGMTVRKSGTTSSLTEGAVRDIDFMTPRMQYNHENGGKFEIRFHRQVLCTPFTKPGDSGSIVLDGSNKVVGLHFAGSKKASVFNRIGYVLNTFDIEIVEEEF